MTMAAGHARAAARLAKAVELALVDVDLTLPQYRLLVYLAEGSVAASALAGKLAVSKPSLTALADGLVAKALVERRAFAGDRRRVDHVLTEDGDTIVVLGAGEDDHPDGLSELGLLYLVVVECVLVTTRMPEDVLAQLDEIDYGVLIEALWDQYSAEVIWLFGFQRGVMVASRSQFGLPA